MNDSPGRTRRRLIHEAQRLFVENGFDATSVREITRAAKANLGAITYHFGSKQALYDAVLEQAFEPVRARARVAFPEGIHPLDAIEVLMRGVFEEMAARPELPQLILQQALKRNSMPAAAKRSLGALFRRLAMLIRQGQAGGSIRAGDSLWLAISVMAQPAYFNLVRRFAPDLLSAERGATKWADVADHMVQFARAGLAVSGATAARPARQVSRRGRK
jgi:AcrR family transcriptional regulator